MGNKQYKLVGAPGFEPGASCAQASRAISWKSFLFNLVFENKRVRKIFASGTVYRNVAPHAQSPPNFPSAKNQRNTFTGSQPLNGANPSVESRRGEAVLILNVNLCCWAVTAMSRR
jgi:hypothetical protein